MNPIPFAMAMTSFASCVAPSPARSESGKFVDFARWTIQTRLQESRAVGIQDVLDDLCSLARDASEPDWNGYGAEPVRKSALKNAEVFLRSLGAAARYPSLGASNKGWVTMQWARSASWALNLLITDDGLIHWAMLLGSERSSGTLPFNGVVPQDIRQKIDRVLNP